MENCNWNCLWKNYGKLEPGADQPNRETLSAARQRGRTRHPQWIWAFGDRSM
jgi:hypothetical protein